LGVEGVGREFNREEVEWNSVIVPKERSYLSKLFGGRAVVVPSRKVRKRRRKQKKREEQEKENSR